MDDKLRWTVLDNAEAVACEACRRILAAAQQSIERRGRFRIVLAGGSTPAQTYRRLARAASDWAHWDLYFGDERCLPEGDPQRNSVMVDRALLDHGAIPRDRVHPIQAHLGPTDAARRYAVIVVHALPFDMVLLGLGEDGHTASLFPGHHHPGGEWVHGVFDAPKPPPERVSLSASALASTREPLFLITGAGKRDAVAAWRRGEDLPVSRIRPAGGADVLIDRAAYG